MRSLQVVHNEVINVIIVWSALSQDRTHDFAIVICCSNFVLFRYCVRKYINKNRRWVGSFELMIGSKVFMQMSKTAATLIRNSWSDPECRMTLKNHTAVVKYLNICERMIFSLPLPTDIDASERSFGRVSWWCPVEIWMGADSSAICGWVFEQSNTCNIFPNPGCCELMMIS